MHHELQERPRSRAVGKLVEARELFIRCSKAACGSPLREECTTRFTQLTADIPSVVPVVTNAAGNPETNVEVNVDGERLTSSLDGHSFLLDPGVREFSFSKDGHIFATQTVMIVQGQRNRLIAASLQSETPRRQPAPGQGQPAGKRTPCSGRDVRTGWRGRWRRRRPTPVDKAAATTSMTPPRPPLTTLTARRNRRPCDVSRR